jgi:hypothetical protein
MLSPGDNCPECGEALALSIGPGRTRTYRGRECELPADFAFATCSGCKAQWMNGAQVSELSEILERLVSGARPWIGQRRLARTVLQGRVPRAVTAFGEWGAWFEAHPEECVVARTDAGPGIDVRTDFLGLGDLPFETMVFGGPLDGETDRYDTWERAEAGHAAMVTRVRNGRDR